MNEDQILAMLARRAIADEQNRFDGPEGAVLGSLAGSSLGVTAMHPLEVSRGKQIEVANDQMRAQGFTPTTAQVLRDRAPGRRMAGGLVGALVGGALGAGTAELVKRESPAARLIAKIQTQNGRLSPSDQQQLQSLLADTYSNISDYR